MKSLILFVSSLYRYITLDREKKNVYAIVIRNDCTILKKFRIQLMFNVPNIFADLNYLVSPVIVNNCREITNVLLSYLNKY